MTQCSVVESDLDWLLKKVVTDLVKQGNMKCTVYSYGVADNLKKLGWKVDWNEEKRYFDCEPK